MRRTRLWRAGIIGLTCVMLVVLVVTMWPTPIDADQHGTIERVLGVLQQWGLPGWFGYRQLEFTANIVMFVPVGFFVGLLLPASRLWAGILIPPLLSGCIEGAQLLFLPERFSTISDVIANSLGGWLGIGVAALVVVRAERSDRGAPR